MLLTIQNENLKLSVDTLGAEMMSLQSSSGVNYLWDGNPKYWDGRAPVLFPYVARLSNNQYTLYGKSYPMEIHGFASRMEFEVEKQAETMVCFCLRENEETLQQYPFHFRFRVQYELCDWTVIITFMVENCDETEMIFGLGGHPAFCVPMQEDTCFEDYELRFSTCCQPDRIGFTKSCYLNGKDTLYPLSENRIMPLRHELFDNDAIVLKNMARCVTLRSDKTMRAVTLNYPQMPYLGIWHQPHTDAPYICIEPWASLPSRQGIVEELSCKSDLIHLAARTVYQNDWAISITEE